MINIKKPNKDLLLSIEADLCFWSFAKAVFILQDFRSELPYTSRHSHESLHVNLENYHTAHLLSAAYGDLDVRIRPDYERDEWSLDFEWFDSGNHYHQRVYSPGA